jgi:hypothetical protein
MKLELSAYNSICGLKVFRINGLDADYKDFGEMYDAYSDHTKRGCCGNMVFAPKRYSKKVLVKYGITPEDYTEVCVQLKNKLSYGLCRLCG